MMPNRIKSTALMRSSTFFSSAMASSSRRSFSATKMDAKGTSIVKEYPFAYTGAEGEIPYYAILNAENEALYQQYKALVSGYEHFHLLGRLAEYKYYNIDAMAKKAMELAERINKQNA